MAEHEGWWDSGGGEGLQAMLLALVWLVSASDGGQPAAAATVASV